MMVSLVAGLQLVELIEAIDGLLATPHRRLGKRALQAIVDRAKVPITLPEAKETAPMEVAEEGRAAIDACCTDGAASAAATSTIASAVNMGPRASAGRLLLAAV